jgi:hypothetical protein
LQFEVVTVTVPVVSIASFAVRDQVDQHLIQLAVAEHADRQG